MFVVGDTRKVLTMSRPMNFNPFRGYSHAERDVRDRVRARADQGHRPAGRRHRHPPRRRGRGGVRAHRGAGQGHHAEHGPRHPARRRGGDQQMHQGHRRRRQPVVGHGAPVPERRGGAAHRAAGPAHDLGPVSHGSDRRRRQSVRAAPPPRPTTAVVPDPVSVLIDEVRRERAVFLPARQEKEETAGRRR